MAAAARIPDRVLRLKLNGRGTDAQFAQDPEPVVVSIAYSLAELHRRPVEGLEPRTPVEVVAAIDFLSTSKPLPYPYGRNRRNTLIEMLRADIPKAAGTAAHTHGAPVVSNALLVDSITQFDETGDRGADPPERDLAIAARSVAETFAPDASRILVEAYEEAGGAPPHGPTLDWFALIAAFR